ncbi:MAG: 4-amino-4-deoxy-L-arabinose transferase or related glycosyltransferase of family [Parcubacteria group bacterium]|nr:4-amino-4-deoxy-L-arabinose transferase or related glycosyltransferase of family [Parcubacteria group bacterium]
MSDKKKIYGVLIGVVLVAAAGLLLYRLGAEPFQDYDEATYAEVTAESMAHGNFLSFTFLNNHYFKKPPLLFWLLSASKDLVPNEELALRLPGALSALALIALVMLVCFEAGGGAASAVLAGAILSTTSAFIEPARQVRFDLLVSFFVVAVLYAGMRAKRDARWYVAAGALFGLAILAKGVIAIFAVIAVGSYILLSTPGALRERFSFLRNGYFWGGVVALLLITVPWHAYETYRFGEEFWDSYLGNEVISRLQMNLFAGTNAPSNLGYLWYLFSFAAPWAELLLGMLLALPFLYKRINIHIRSTLYASIITILSLVVVLALSQTKAVSYLIPLYPFIAIALALGIVEFCRKSRSSVRFDIVCALVFLALFGFGLTLYNAFHINPYYSLQETLATEEKAVGLIIHSTNPSPAVYEYQYDSIGSIQFYGELPFTANPYVLLLSNTSEPVPGSLVVTTAASATLTQQFPHHHFTPEYIGTSVSLFRIDR